MRHRQLLLSLLLIPLLAITVTGCKKKSADVSPADTPVDTGAPTAPEPERTEVEEPPFEGRDFGQDEPDEPTDLDVDSINRSGVLRTVYFAFDSSELSDLARQALRANAEWLKSHGDYGVAVEGHCDERGTIEYNLELGQRRASAVRDYLATLGVERSRIRAISYGEERPADTGSGEAAWSRNRRAEFKAE